MNRSIRLLCLGLVFVLATAGMLQLSVVNAFASCTAEYESCLTWCFAGGGCGLYCQL